MLPLLLVVEAVLFGQAKPEVPPKERPYWLEMAKAHIKDCEVFPANDREQPYRLMAEPVFHHIQATRAKSVGSVFLFVDETGRPAAVGDVFFFPKKTNHTMYNEWHSLAAAPITVRWEGRELLAPTTAGLKWSDIPDTAAPAAGRPERERQLRHLSRRFTGHLVDAKKDRYELRLLTTPLYQYHAPEKGDDQAEFLTGAVFTLCQETDPEIFLLVEARRTEKGARWVYAVAEFSNLNLVLELDGKEVWSANPPIFNVRGPHSAGILKEVELAVPPNDP